MICANLELHLRPVGDDEYEVGMIFWAPGSADQSVLVAEPLPHLRLDVSALLSQSLDTRAYGEALTAQLFCNPRLKIAFAEARAFSTGAQVTLRIAIRLSSADDGLHSLRWETLCDPDQLDFLFTSERVLVTRYLAVSATKAVLPRTAGELRALVVIANPTDLEVYQRSPVDVVGELERCREALGKVPVTVLARELTGQPVTPSQIAAALRDGVDVFYLVAHGSHEAGEAHLWLEREDGASQQVSAEDVARLFARLATNPLLVVLAACQSAGQSHDMGALSAIGPQIVAAGVAAVVAMQDNVTQLTVSKLMPVLFHELLRDGMVDRALAVARSTVLDRPDWWVPVLYLRLREGRLFTPEVLPKPPCPYPGMIPFRVEDTHFFYGREPEIRQMLQHLRYHRLLFVISPSGTGKSSLIQAGLLPRLGTSGFFPVGTLLVREIRPGTHPLQALSQALEGGPGTIDSAIRNLLETHPPAQRLILVVDQFEEVFTQAEREERHQFIAVLQRLRASEQCLLIIAMRADFYSNLMTSELWPVDAAERLELTPLRGSALCKAIEQPAKDIGVLLEPRLLERLLADAADEPGVLPLLQETMVLLWEQMANRSLTLEAYQQLGRDGRSGLAIALATKADATFISLTPEQQQIARRIFLRLIQFGEGRADTRRQQSPDDLISLGDDKRLFEQTVLQLADARLLTLRAGEGVGERKVDIAHEALIEGWPTLQRWIGERRAAELTRRRLEAKAEEWVRLKRGADGLLGRQELIIAARWLAGQDSTDLGSSQNLRDLVAASNPGWSRSGLTAISLAIVGVGLLLILLLINTYTLPPIYQVLVWVLPVICAVWGLLALRAQQHSDSFALQRFTQWIGARKVARGLAFGWFLLSGIALGAFGVGTVYQDSACRALGYDAVAGKQGVVILTDADRGVSPADADAVAVTLSEYREIQAWFVPSEQTRRQCAKFFRHQLVLRQDSTSDGQQAYTATLLDAPKSALNPTQQIGPATCGTVILLAHKVAQYALNAEPVARITESRKRPDPTSCQAYLENKAGYDLLAQEAYVSAESRLIEALRLDSGYATAHYNLATVYLRLGRYAEAKSHAQQAISLTDNADTAFLSTLAVICWRQNDFTCAEQRMREALTVTMSSADRGTIYNNLLGLYADMGETRWLDADEALRQARAQLDLIPVAEKARREQLVCALDKNEGRLALDRDQFAHAQELLYAAYGCFKSNSSTFFKEDTLYHLALSYELDGNQGQACQYWKEYLGLDAAKLPDDSRVEGHRKEAERHRSGCTM